MKKKYLIPSLVAVAIVCLGIIAKTASTDLFTVTGRGSSWGQDIFRITSALGLSLSNSSGTDVFTIDTNGNIQTYNNITVGDDTAPSASFYPGVKIPIYFAKAVTQGDVIISSAAVGSTAYGSTAFATSTTTVIGVCDGTYASGDVGYITISGYALIKTTGAVQPGDLLVSSAPHVSGSYGYSGTIAAGAAVVAGSIVGKAVGRDSSNLALAIVDMQ